MRGHFGLEVGAILSSQFAARQGAMESCRPLYRPCVDCGKFTDSCCDLLCSAELNLPSEQWIRDQFTPHCEECDFMFGSCHFCRKVDLAVPPPWREEESGKTKPMDRGEVQEWTSPRSVSPTASSSSPTEEVASSDASEGWKEAVAIYNRRMRDEWRGRVRQREGRSEESQRRVRQREGRSEESQPQPQSQ